MKTLIINAHPDFDSTASYTNQLYQYLIRQWEQMDLEGRPEILTLYNEEIPTITKQFLHMYKKTGKDLTFTDEEQALYSRMRELLDQFKQHKRIILFMPVHNFNIPAKLKDYMDQILIPRETYRYTENGSVGMMKDGRKALLVQSSGSIYTNDDRYTPLEYGYFYLKSMFEEIMGFDSFQIIRAQGTDLDGADREAILQAAYTEIDAVLPAFMQE